MNLESFLSVLSANGWFGIVTLLVIVLAKTLAPAWLARFALRDRRDIELTPTKYGYQLTTRPSPPPAESPPQQAPTKTPTAICGHSDNSVEESSVAPP